MDDQAVQLYQTQDITIFRPPEDILEEAHKAARALQDVIKQTNAVVKLGNSEHLKAEAWQTLGHFYGLAARTRETRFVQFGDVCGFESTAELVNIKTGAVISVADSMTLNDEDRWSSRSKYEYQNGQRVKVGDEKVPLFQLRSMAQTRAISKVHSNVLKWVVVLAGYSPTPAEEVDEETVRQEPPAPRAMPQRQSPAGTNPRGKVVYAKCKDAGMDNAAISAFAKKHGSPNGRTDAIPVGSTDAALAELTQPQPQPPEDF